MLEARLKARLGAFELDVDLAMGREVFALLGPSGAGKTLTLGMIAGFRRPDEGRVTLDGTTLLDRARGVDLRPERRRIGYVLQEP